MKSMKPASMRPSPKRTDSDYSIDYSHDSVTGKRTGHRGSKMEAADEDEVDSTKFQISWIVLGLWFVVAALMIYDMVQLSNQYMGMDDDSCCGYDIELGVIPTIFYFVTMVNWSLSVLFMICSAILKTKQESYVPLVHVTFTLSPIFEALMFWLLLYTTNQRDAQIYLILNSIRIFLQLTAMAFALKTKKGCIKTVWCHALIQCSGLAALIVVYILYVDNGGVCYVVEKEATYFGGCEVCPYTGLPPNQDGECEYNLDNFNSTVSEPVSKKELDSATFCSAHNPDYDSEFEQNSCWFPASSQD